MTERDESYYEAQQAEAEAAQAEAEAALAAFRAPKIEAVLSSLTGAADLTADLVGHRDALHDCQTRQVLSSIISMITSAQQIAMSDLAALNAKRGEQ